MRGPQVLPHSTVREASPKWDLLDLGADDIWGYIVLCGEGCLVHYGSLVAPWLAWLCRASGHWFDSQSGHVPGLPAQSLMFLLHIDVPLPLFLPS